MASRLMKVGIVECSTTFSLLRSSAALKVSTLEFRHMNCNMRIALQFFLLLAWFVPNTIGSEPTGIRIIPNDIFLTGKESSQHVAIHYVMPDGILGASIGITPKMMWTDSSVAMFESTVIRPIKNGVSTLRVECVLPNGQTAIATASVRCNEIDMERGIEFSNHVQSVLSKRGCNTGACHGALAGKGGFRLSLRGYDPDSDYFNITRQDRGRRVELSDAVRSLLIAKPSGTLPHKGGVRLPNDSDDYTLISKWISQGATGPMPTEPVLQSIEVLPDRLKLNKGDRFQLIVRAQYGNGRIEDVTQWTKFSAADESIVTVNENGLATIVGSGESAIVTWFASRIAMTTVSVPFFKVNSENLNTETEANLIDVHVAKQLASLGLAASAPCSDSEFVRRAALDATGSLPTEQQVLEFLNDPSPDKRARWIDALLESPEYVDYWTYRWSDLLMLNSNLLRSDGVKAYYQWIRSHVQKNTPWNRFVSEILTARGDALENGATNFYAIHQDPESMTENACQAFLGLSIGCARCHNHPLEKWTNDQYYAMANLFARVRSKGWGGDARDGDAARTVMVLDRGDLIQPLRGKPQPPAPLDAPPLDENSTADRRVYLAEWMTAPTNPYFARAIVNRVWAAYLGIGIINPVDDLRMSNPASNPALLDALCQHLIEHDYDLKELMRLILNSQTYQRSSLTNDRNVADRKFFSHYYPRRLMAEVLHDAIATVTTVPTLFDKVAFLGGDKRPTKFYGKGTKAIQLFDSSVDNNFLKTFGRNQRRITCECERSDEPNIVQVLNLNNGDTLNNKLAEKGSIVDVLMERFVQDDAGLIRTVYLKTLCRFPTESEVQRLSQELSNLQNEEKRTVVEDLLWSLMTSREFLFNH